ncbi:hypothetical protein VTN77DRAFT_9301 [Rasamsonia byssochlamydoides]|uniref:uncharacterized protein n=1 Tax=Rasamsonia byssochlamydoides TaxID=89139 RepID=UPI003742EEBB
MTENATQPTRRTVISADGTKIWAEAVGNRSNPAVVFLHGFASSCAVFEKQFADALLVRNLYLIRYDLRGHGRSDQPTTPEAYTSAQMAEDLAAVCEAFGVTRPYLAGWSYGALIATDVCAHYRPEFVTGIILLAGIPYKSAHEAVADPWVFELLPRLLSADVDVFFQACIDLADSCFSPDYPVSDETKWAWMGVVAAQTPAVRRIMATRTQDEMNLLSALHWMPFLVIQGTADRHIRHEKLEALMRTLFPAVTEYHRLEGVGHACFYEKPEEVDRLIVEFVQRNQARRAAVDPNSSSSV